LEVELSIGLHGRSQGFTSLLAYANGTMTPGCCSNWVNPNLIMIEKPMERKRGVGRMQITYA